MLRYSLTAVFTRVDCFEQLFVQQCDVVPQRLMAEGFFILAPAETRGITSNYLTKGDWRRDAVLYIGRDRGRMKLMELSAGIGNID